jgi:hypothetical protein
MSRPEKPIDWKLVDSLLMKDNDGTEIASHFDMHPDTFYRRIQEQYDMGFTEYQQRLKSKGNSFLKSKQFDKAMEGNVQMLIFLGKTRLKQVETQATIQIDTKTEEDFKNMMEMLQNSQSARKIESNSISAETKSE